MNRTNASLSLLATMCCRECACWVLDRKWDGSKTQRRQMDSSTCTWLRCDFCSLRFPVPSFPSPFLNLSTQIRLKSRLRCLLKLSLETESIPEQIFCELISEQRGSRLKRFTCNENRELKALHWVLAECETRGCTSNCFFLSDLIIVAADA